MQFGTGMAICHPSLMYARASHIPLDKMAAISLTIFSDALSRILLSLSWMKRFEFLFAYHGFEHQPGLSVETGPSMRLFSACPWSNLCAYGSVIGVYTYYTYISYLWGFDCLRQYHKRTYIYIYVCVCVTSVFICKYTIAVSSIHMKNKDRAV